MKTDYSVATRSLELEYFAYLRIYLLLRDHNCARLSLQASTPLIFFLNDMECIATNGFTEKLGTENDSLVESALTSGEKAQQ